MGLFGRWAPPGGIGITESRTSPGKAITNAEIARHEARVDRQEAERAARAKEVPYEDALAKARKALAREKRKRQPDPRKVAKLTANVRTAEAKLRQAQSKRASWVRTLSRRAGR